MAAGAGLWQDRMPRWLRRGGATVATGMGALRSVHSGHAGDNIASASLGTAVVAMVLLLGA